MAVVGLKLFAEAHVKRADDEEGDGDAQVDEIVHDVAILRHEAAERELKAARDASKLR